MSTEIKPTVMYYKSGENDTVRFVTGTLVLEETVKNGYYTAKYWSGSNQVQRENITANMPHLDPAADPITSFLLEIDGQSLHNRWKFSGHSQEINESGHVISTTTLVHELRNVTVNVCTKLDGTSFLTRWLEIKNTDKRVAALSKVAPFSGLLWQNEFNVEPFIENILSKNKNLTEQFSLAYIDACKYGEEFNLKWIDITCPEYVFASHRRKIYGSPYYIVKNNVSGETFYIALAYSGSFETKFKYNRYNKTLCFETGPAGKAPLRVLEPGETVTSPAVHIGVTHSDLDEITSDWYNHLRSSVIPQRLGNKRMYTIAGRVVEEPGDWILREIDIAHEMGAEAFMVDAGWYGEPFSGWWMLRGDWFEGSFLPEGGIAGIRDYCHKKGMLFGLWMETEALCPETKAYKNNPHFKSSYEPQKLPHAADSWEVNLSNPDCAKYITDCIKEVIVNKKLDFFKLDYNIEPYDGLATDKLGYAENNTWRHFEVLYKAFDDAREGNPGVAYENCASGGGRNDLGMMSHFNYATQSDFSQMPLSIRCINEMTLFLPPESICYYHNHSFVANQLAGIDTHLRVCLFALPIFVGFGAQNADRTSLYFQKTREYMELAKGFCRPVLAEGASVYHHTPYLGMVDPIPFCVLEYAMKDKSRGYCGVFKLDSGEKTYNLRLRGIDESKKYEITKHNSGASFVVSGYELANFGINITLQNINTSELILYKQI